MKPEERMELIRSRFKPRQNAATKPKGVHCAQTGTQPTPPKKDFACGWDIMKPFPLNSGGANFQKLDKSAEWLREPIKQTAKPCSPKRTEKVSPLTRISQLLPLRLARIRT